jgi:glutaredoxin 3
MSAAKTKAQGIIDDNAVAVFSKSYCPYCKATKATLSELGAKFYTIELDQVGTYSLKAFSGYQRAMLTEVFG